MTNQYDLDRIYRTRSPEDIPWSRDDPPRALVEFLEKGRVSPCKTIDLGCGTGNYSIYLAGRGFDVTGVDFAPTAIKQAMAKAGAAGIPCLFLAADLLGELVEITESFDFAYDWHLMHHIYPENRQHYTRNVNRLLAPGGRYLSVCFSEDDPAFGGTGKYRTTSMGTRLYFSSEKEMRELFEPNFVIEELKTIETEGKTAPHLSVWAFMIKI
ncbi:class I SAM-dependent methyltransferase [Acidobacteriota bacterium]